MHYSINNDIRKKKRSLTNLSWIYERKYQRNYRSSIKEINPIAEQTTLTIIIDTTHISILPTISFI